MKIESRLGLPYYLTDNKLLGEGVELGVLFGKFSVHMLENWIGKCHLIDPWENQSPEIYLDGSNAVNLPRAMEITRAAVSKYGDRARLIRMFSVDAVNLFLDNQLVWFHCDANHSLDSVRADLRAWYPKVRSGGIFSGHDFYNRHDDWHNCGVQQAVEEFCEEMKLEFYTTECTSWWIHKP